MKTQKQKPTSGGIMENDISRLFAFLNKVSPEWLHELSLDQWGTAYAAIMAYILVDNPDAVKNAERFSEENDGLPFFLVPGSKEKN